MERRGRHGADRAADRPGGQRAAPRRGRRRAASWFPPAPSCAPRSWGSSPRSGCRSSWCASARAWRSCPRATRSPSPATSASPARSSTRIASRCAASSRRRAAAHATTASSPTASTSLPRALAAAAAARRRRAHLGRGVGGRLRPRQGRAAGRGRHRLLAGGDAAGPSARGRAASAARSSSGCPATRWPRCSPSTSSCGPRCGSSRAGASCSRRASTRWPSSPCGKKTGRREFKRGILAYRRGAGRCGRPGPQGSGILTSMTQANCFIVLEEERGDVAAGRDGSGSSRSRSPDRHDRRHRHAS